ncbi:hypothetical protein NVP1055O_66 [Vibrio phage 1.055.O._10N.286.55.E9]|nr:hypothetical protein NVP1055O_66 [Vibrio phage 1.055.O._10N.286.55.E9]
MKNQSLENNLFCRLTKLRGKAGAVMYRESADMFNAQVESLIKHDYFIESSQYESLEGVLEPREYHLKCIGESHTYKMIDFKTRKLAMDFYNSIEVSKNGALILESFNTSSINVLAHRLRKYGCDKCVYDNGLTSLHISNLSGYLVSYCDGEVCIMHCLSYAIFNNEVKSHIDCHKENNR